MCPMYSVYSGGFTRKFCIEHCIVYTKLGVRGVYEGRRSGICVTVRLQLASHHVKGPYGAARCLVEQRCGRGGTHIVTPRAFWDSHYMGGMLSASAGAHAGDVPQL